MLRPTLQRLVRQRSFLSGPLARLVLLPLMSCGGGGVAVSASHAGADGGAATSGAAAGTSGAAAELSGAPSTVGGAPAGTTATSGGASSGQALGGAAGSTGGNDTTAAAGVTASAGVGGASGAGGLAAGGNAGMGTGGAPIINLFDGQDLSQWTSRNGGGDAPWVVDAGAFTVVPGTGDIETRQAFGDVELHVEFWIPSTPVTNAEQDRGNSGVYLMGRYEVQVLDSYMHPLQDANDCGAIYELKNADVNAALPPETWQTYDITFHAPLWTGSTKTANARISVIWNGKTAHTDVEIPAPTRLGDAEAPGNAPLRLQDHNHRVRFRNISLRLL